MLQCNTHDLPIQAQFTASVACFVISGLTKCSAGIYQQMLAWLVLKGFGPITQKVHILLGSQTRPQRHIACALHATARNSVWKSDQPWQINPGGQTPRVYHKAIRQQRLQALAQNTAAAVQQLSLAARPCCHEQHPATYSLISTAIHALCTDMVGNTA